MRQIQTMFLAIGPLLCASARSQETQPAAAPATQPTDRAPASEPRLFELRGSVSISSGWELQKPDLSRAVIYLASSPMLDAAPPPKEPAFMAQKNKAFAPGLLVIPRGETVEFPNLDDFDHNVFSRSAAAPAFDLDRYKRGQSKGRVFDKVGVVQVFCNIHPGMRALIVVTPNPYFARADANGRFMLKNVPAGDYELVVWQERCKEIRRPVKAGPEASPELTFMLEESRQNIIANNPPARSEGYGIERGLGIKRERLDLPVVHDAHPAPPASPTANP